MPILDKPRHEAFARARARGAYFEEAYDEAGFAPGQGHASRLAKTPSVADRIAELRALDAGVDETSSQAVVAALLRIAKASENLGGVGALKEARLTLLDIHRLSSDVEKGRRV
jgi:hypothetical protein